MTNRPGLYASWGEAGKYFLPIAIVGSILWFLVVIGIKSI
jgi:hypothetical protein